jgi:hypothetical protein
MSTNKNHLNDWGAKLLAWTTSEEGKNGNKNISAFCKATDSAMPSSDRLKAITSTQEIMALAVTEDNKIVVLHSIKNMGGL